jgi:hypothetical protein
MTPPPARTHHQPTRCLSGLNAQLSRRIPLRHLAAFNPLRRLACDRNFKPLLLGQIQTGADSAQLVASLLARIDGLMAQIAGLDERIDELLRR